MKKFTIIICFIVLASLLQAQNADKAETFNFTIDTQVKATPVKNQSMSGTCWAFAGISFIESELLKMGKPELDLSEMYIVRQVYSVKAENYLRMQGKANLSSGGQGHDVINCIKKNGLMPEEAYSGINYNSKIHNHSELDIVYKSIADALIQNEGTKYPEVWSILLNNTLDTYLGEIPSGFQYKGKKINPEIWAQDLGFESENYIELTSFSSYPSNTFVTLQIPDNWSHDVYYNVSLEELMATIDLALKSGYSICWDGDVSGDFSSNGGYAILPDSKLPVTSESRQIAFDKLETTDDHLMHIIGIAFDQFGTKYYLTKNSWGTDTKYDGYWYMSEDFVKLNTIAILINKKALPESLSEKLKN